MKTGHQPDTRHQPDNEHKTPSGHRTPARSWIMNLCVKQTMPDAGHGAARHQCNGHRTPDTVLYNIESICQTQDSALYMPDTRIDLSTLYSPCQTQDPLLSMPDTRLCTLHARHTSLYSSCQRQDSIIYMPDTRLCTLYARLETQDCTVVYSIRQGTLYARQSITRLKTWERRKF